MDRELWRLLQGIPPTGGPSGREGTWQPPADVYETGTGWLVKFDLAGVRPEDIRLEVRGRLLTVSGVRRDLAIRGRLRARSMEIAYNRFQRSIEFPRPIEGVKLAMDYRDGMLLIELGQAGGRSG